MFSLHSIIFFFIVFLSISYSESTPLEDLTTSSSNVSISQLLIINTTNSSTNFSTTNLKIGENGVQIEFPPLNQSSRINESRVLLATNDLPLSRNQNKTIQSSMNRTNSSEYEESSSVDEFARLTGLLYEQTTTTTTTKMPNKNIKTTTKFSGSKFTTESLDSDSIRTKFTTKRYRKHSFPSTTRTTTMRPSRTSTPDDRFVDQVEDLSQGSTLLLFLLAALLFCACLMASTIAIAKTRHNLKRRSRITEMEAQLEKTFLYY